MLAWKDTLDYKLISQISAISIPANILEDFLHLSTLVLTFNLNVNKYHFTKKVGNRYTFICSWRPSFPLLARCWSHTLHGFSHCLGSGVTPTIPQAVLWILTPVPWQMVQTLINKREKLFVWLVFWSRFQQRVENWDYQCNLSIFKGLRTNMEAAVKCVVCVRAPSFLVVNPPLHPSH